VLRFLFLLVRVAIVAVVLLPLRLVSAAPLDSAHPAVRAVMAVQKEVTAEWMRQPEVLGTAVAIGRNGAPVLLVYVDRDATRATDVIRQLPQQIRGVAVEVRLTDKFRALRHRHRPKGKGNNIHELAQAPPIQLGTSGGWTKDFTGRFCCGGTLGALIQIGGQQYVLSN